MFRPWREYLDREKARNFQMDDGTVRLLLAQGQAAIQRGLKEVYLVNAAGVLKTRGEKSYLFDFEQPSADPACPCRCRRSGVDQGLAQQRIPRPCGPFGLSRPAVYSSLARSMAQYWGCWTKPSRQPALYQQLEADRGKILFNFGLLYLGFAVILIVAAVWGGLWFAERLSRPVGRLASAAQRVGAGDLDVQVVEEEADDEIAMLGPPFQPDDPAVERPAQALVEGHDRTEEQPAPV